MVLYISLVFFVCLLGANIKSSRWEGQQYSGEKMNGKDFVCLTTIFILLFIISAVREGIGVDYYGYTDLYDRIQNHIPVHTEIGFNLLAQLIGKTFNSSKLLIAIFAFFTLLLFITGIYQQSRLPGYSLFLFMAMGFYFLSFNSIRYYLALSMAFYSVKYLKNHKLWKFSALILAATCFHKSVMIVLPCYWLANRTIKPIHVMILCIAAFSMLFFKGFFRTIAFTFYPYYENSVYDGGSASVFNILKSGAVLALGILFYKKTVLHDWYNRFYFNLNIAAFLLYVCCSWIPELSRIGYYFNFGTIILIPNIMMKLNKRYNRVLVGCLAGIAFFLYLCLMLSQSYSHTIQLLPYKSWIEF